ncbi:MAG: hypothetical protein ACI9TV_000149 [Sulfurimonas sp.]|jgi:hypothetical protein|uniref:hypothetical protein n=1 Tax=Sulfurimonas sp. TaxID=2022749 RepID=UPI0039E3B6B4
MLEVLLGTKNRELTLQYLLTFKEGYAFLEELTALLNKAKEYYKPELKEKFELQRKRPRRPEKPL